MLNEFFNAERERKESKKEEKSKSSEEDDEEETTVEPTTAAVTRRGGKFLRVKRRKVRPMELVNSGGARNHGHGTHMKPHFQKEVKAKIARDRYKKRFARYLRLSSFA